MSVSSPQIKNFIVTSYDYQRRKTDRNLMQVQRQLQILSVVNDLHVFEASSTETLEFYVCLENLLKSADAKSSLAWKIITLFAHLSQSQTIRVSLRDDIKLVPVLCDFLTSTKFSKDKTFKLLQLIEAVSYKIKIPYTESWVISLIRFLADIVKSDDTGDLFISALSILANLCRFNPPALTCLRSYASSKPIVHRLIDMNNPTNKETLLAAEMMLYLHQDFSRVGRTYVPEQVENVVDCILKTAGDGFSENDVVCLQLAVDVFSEFVGCPSLEEILRGRDYTSFIQGMLKCLTQECPESAVEIFMDLLYRVVDLDQSSMQPLHEDIFVKVKTWMTSDQCCLAALLVLRTLIIINDKFVDSQHVEQLISALMAALDMDESMDISSQKLHQINGMLVLLEELCNHDTTLRMKLAMNFQAPKLSNLLKQILAASSPFTKNNETIQPSIDVSINSTWRELEFCSSARMSKTLREERISQAVVSIMNVVKLMASHNGDFVIEYEQMLNNPGTMKHIVRCERSNNRDLIAKSMGVLSKGNIPNASMSALVSALEESNKCTSEGERSGISMASQAGKTSMSFSPDIEARVDEVIERLRGSVDKLELKDMSLNAVMDVYEYRLASMAHAEKTIEDALAGADNRYRQTHLTLLQTRSQNDSLRNLLMKWEERFCVIQQEKTEAEENISKIQKSTKQFRENLISEKTAVERENQELRAHVKEVKSVVEIREENIKRLQRQNQEAQADNKNLHRVLKEEQDKYQKLQHQNQKLTDDVKKGARDYENMEKECQKLEKSMTELKKENSELEMLIHSHEEAMASKENELEQISKSYNELKRIQDLIHNMSAGKLQLSSM